MNVDWHVCEQEFTPDGALRDIQVVDATTADSQRVLDFLRASAVSLTYTVDGASATLPSDASSIIALRATATPLLIFRWGDIDVATHFFGADDLEFDFRPEDIRGQEQLDQLISFIHGVGGLLHKSVLVYPEGCEMNPFFIYDPQTDDIAYSPQRI